MLKLVYLKKYMRASRGYRPSILRRAHGSWFRFVAAEGDLDAEDLRALDAVADWLDELESSALPKSFQLAVLEVLLEADALTTGLPPERPGPAQPRRLSALARTAP